MGNGGHPGERFYARFQLPWQTALPAINARGSIAWAAGEVPLVVAMALLIQWQRSDRRTATRLDRAAERDHDAEMAATTPCSPNWPGGTAPAAESIPVTVDPQPGPSRWGERMHRTSVPGAHWRMHPHPPKKGLHGVRDTDDHRRTHHHRSAPSRCGQPATASGWPQQRGAAPPRAPGNRHSAPSRQLPEAGHRGRCGPLQRSASVMLGGTVQYQRVRGPRGRQKRSSLEMRATAVGRTWPG